jgi:hypothetical protein
LHRRPEAFVPQNTLPRFWGPLSASPVPSPVNGENCENRSAPSIANVVEGHGAEILAPRSHEDLANPLKDEQGLALAGAKANIRARKSRGLDNDF